MAGFGRSWPRNETRISQRREIEVGRVGHAIELDLDIWVRPTRDNAEPVLAALGAFGAPLFGLSVGDSPDLVWIEQEIKREPPR